MHVLVWKRQFELWLVIMDCLGLLGWSYPEAKQKAVADLVNDIFDAIKSDRLSDESICETHICWVFFGVTPSFDVLLNKKIIVCEY